MHFLAYKGVRITEEGEIFSPSFPEKWEMVETPYGVKPFLKADSLEGRGGIYAGTFKQASGFYGNRVFLVAPWLPNDEEIDIFVGENGWRAAGAILLKPAEDDTYEDVISAFLMGYDYVPNVVIEALSKVRNKDIISWCLDKLKADGIIIDMKFLLNSIRSGGWEIVQDAVLDLLLANPADFVRLISFTFTAERKKIFKQCMERIREDDLREIREPLLIALLNRGYNDLIVSFVMKLGETDYIHEALDVAKVAQMFNDLLAAFILTGNWKAVEDILFDLSLTDQQLFCTLISQADDPEAFLWGIEVAKGGNFLPAFANQVILANRGKFIQHIFPELMESHPDLVIEDIAMRGEFDWAEDAQILALVKRGVNHPSRASSFVSAVGRKRPRVLVEYVENSDESELYDLLAIISIYWIDIPEIYPAVLKQERLLNSNIVSKFTERIKKKFSEMSE
ncbi:MAG: hypothetical protein QXL34_06540 [Thermosphaera sp.]